MKKRVYLDLETTGFDPKKDEIIEVAFIIEEDGNETLRYETLVRPEGDIPEIVQQITNITPQMAAEQGRPWAEVQQEIFPLLEGATMIGHNIDFDIRFLQANGVDFPSRNRIDTHELARILWVDKASYSLEVLAEELQLDHTDAHRAMSDVIASRELMNVLEKELQTLPQDFVTTAKGFLQRTKWHATPLITTATGGPKTAPFVRKTADATTPKAIGKAIETLPGQPHIMRAWDSFAGATWLKTQAHNTAATGKKSLIISSKLGFFAGIPVFPTPEVLFDFSRFMAWWNDQPNPTDTQCAFALQCLHRHLHGLRGKRHFNLYVDQFDWWSDVCMHPESEDYATIKTEKDTLPVLTITPAAFWRMPEAFKHRTLFIDEAELFVREMVFAPTKKVSLRAYLNNKETEVTTSFFIADFCRNILEPLIGHELLGPPVTVPLPNGQSYPKEAKRLTEIAKTADLAEAAQILSDGGGVRWAQYFPTRGELNLHQWKGESWAKMREILPQLHMVLLARHRRPEQFFQYWLGGQCSVMPVPEALMTYPSIEMMHEGLSTKSPEYNSQVAERIATHTQTENPDALIVAFSGQESLKKVYITLKDDPRIKGYTLLGERVAGGNGKLVHALEQSQEKTILLLAGFLRPELADFPAKKLLLQRFPFYPPHPVLSHIEATMKANGGSFWDLWTMPITAANLSRRTASCPHIRTVGILDSRMHAKWGTFLVDLALKP